jgi:hypothetical protein
MDALTAIESENELLDSENEVHCEGGGGETTQSSVRKCRQSLGTMYHWSDSVFSSEESPLLDYFELFLLPDMMNLMTIETKFYTYITSRTPSTRASYL